jgi:iron complex transport system permease protein
MTQLLPHKSLKILGLALGLCLFLISFGSSIVFGLTPITPETALNAFLHFDPTSEHHNIVRTSRLPRALIATIIGASLAVAGALMQALTRNPLASPSILGINAGALFFVTVAATMLSVSSLLHYMWIAFLGAGVAALLVLLLGSLGRDGLTPIKIILAGAAITALFASLTQGLLVLNEVALEEVLFWIAGSVSGRTIEMLIPVLPFLVVAGLAAMAIANSINVWSSGEDVAKGLGQRTIFVKIAMTVIFVILAGGSVAIAGQIVFVGLIIPHIARVLVGLDYRWIIPYCVVLGATLLLLADVAARFIIMPQEVPIGVMTAVIGTPFFIYIARRGFNKG